MLGSPDLNMVTRKVIGAAIEVHRILGPGLLESAYERCLCHGLSLGNVPFERQVVLPVMYKGKSVNAGYRLDLLVDQVVVVEIKAVEKVIPVYKAQLLTYLKLGGWQLGLLLNFNAPLLKDGITRIVLNYQD